MAKALQQLRSMAMVTYFRIPEQGMDHFELLSRASCFVVSSPEEPNKDQSLRVLCSAHVVAPYAFMHLFPEAADWLSFVKPEHVRVLVVPDVAPVGGQKVKAAELVGLQRHPTRDVACGKISNQASFVAELEENGLQICTLRLGAVDRGTINLTEEDCLLCDGHVLTEDQEDVSTSLLGNDEGLYGLDRCQVEGALLYRSEHQCFLQTAETLQMGMCGGPVLRCADSDEVVGLVEGIVPHDCPTAEVRGAAVCVEPFDLHHLLCLGASEQD